MPWLAILVALAGIWAVDHLELYFAVGFPVAFFGTWRALGRVRKGLRASHPEAPRDATLLLGGTTFWRDLGLAWLDGPTLRFVGGKSRWNVARSEITRVQWRPFAREMDLFITREGKTERLKFGGLISLTDLPRFARIVRQWHANEKTR